LVIAKAGADDGIRTRDLRFTKPLLYQLSYVGAERQNIVRQLPDGKESINTRSMCQRKLMFVLPGSQAQS
jgi:hypothetical protein